MAHHYSTFIGPAYGRPYASQLTSLISAVLSTGLQCARLPECRQRESVYVTSTLNTLSMSWAQVYRWLISYITLLSDGTPANMRMYFIFLENKSPGLHFAADSIGLSSLKFFWWAPEFLFTLARGRFRRSRASKVTDIGANRKRWADFLLVPNSNFGPILHRF